MTAREHADKWLAAWNAHDLEAILSCYADDVVFTASTVIARWDRADGTLRGKDELRRHFAKGLELAPALRFEEERLLEAPTGYALFYRRENGNNVADVVEVDAGGLAARVTAYYGTPQA